MKKVHMLGSLLLMVALTACTAGTQEAEAADSEAAMMIRVQ